MEAAGLLTRSRSDTFPVVTTSGDDVRNVDGTIQLRGSPGISPEFPFHLSSGERGENRSGAKIGKKWYRSNL